MEQELLTLPERLSSPTVFSGVRVARYLVFCAVFFISLFVLFHLDIVLSVLRFTNSDYPFGIFKLLFCLHLTSHKGLKVFNEIITLQWCKISIHAYI